MKRVIKATANYTGGGCYLYTGSCGGGLYFMAATDWMDYAIILTDDPDQNLEEASTEEWQNAHRWAEMCGRDAEELLAEAFDYIIANAPEGNYCTGDIIEAKSKLTTVTGNVEITTDKVVIIRECYAPADDMTFIRRDVEDRNGNLVSMEVVGFYCGEPDAEATKTYMGSLKAEYNG